MAVEAVLAVVLAISVVSLVVAFFLARQVLAADTGQPEMQEISARDPRGRRGLPLPAVPDHRLLAVVAAAVIFGFYYVNREVKNIAEMGSGHGLEGHPLVRHRRPLLGHRRLHRHVRLDPRQHPHRRRGHDQPQPGAAASPCAAARSAASPWWP